MVPSMYTHQKALPGGEGDFSTLNFTRLLHLDCTIPSGSFLFPQGLFMVITLTRWHLHETCKVMPVSVIFFSLSTHPSSHELPQGHVLILNEQEFTQHLL